MLNRWMDGAQAATKEVGWPEQRAGQLAMTLSISIILCASLCSVQLLRSAHG